MTPECNTALLEIVKDAYGRLVYTHKTHEKQREFTAQKASAAKRGTVITIGLTFAALLVGSLYPILIFLTTPISIFASLFSLCLTLYQLAYPLDKEETQHNQCAKKLLVYRDKLILLIYKLMMTDVENKLLEQEFEETQAFINSIYENAPSTSSQAYQAAQNALKNSEEMYFSQCELDVLLPASLRLCHPSDILRVPKQP